MYFFPFVHVIISLIILFFYMYLLLSSRGPWGALSPIPENNAIATNAQVNKTIISPSYSILYIKIKKKV